MRYKDIEVGQEYLVKVKRRYDSNAITYHARVIEKGVPRTRTGRYTFGGVDPKGVRVELFARVAIRNYFNHGTREWDSRVSYEPVASRLDSEGRAEWVVPFTNVMEPWAPLAKRCAEQIKASKREAKKNAKLRAARASRQEAIEADIKRRRIKARVVGSEVRMSHQAFQGLLKRLDNAQGS